ncbi:MAG: hypothetical protein HYX25_01990 [Candidatus Solibacter usitatus]|nr:hypothetical protein [Candidatus Solibacter usitatus]
MKSTLRNFVLALVCCGLLVPVVSTTDDLVLLSAAVQRQASSGPNELQGRLSGVPDDASLFFWTQFEHMDFPVLPAAMPEIGRAAAIAPVEPALVSVDAPNCSVRGPPVVAAA